MSPSNVIARTVADELAEPAPIPAETPVGSASDDTRPTSPLLTAPRGTGQTAPGSAVLRGGEVADLPVVDFLHPPTIATIGAIGKDGIDDSAGAGAGRADGANGIDQHNASQAELDAAYERGVTDGRAAAQTAVEDAATRARDAFAQAIDVMQARLDATKTEADGVIVELAIEIARLILAREITTATDPGRDAILRCLAELTTTAPATFHLNPADVAALGELNDILAGRSIEVVPDPTVASGDAVVEAAGGRIDGSIAGALQRVAEVLDS